MKTITITLTVPQAEALLFVASNGYSYGELFQDDDGNDSGYGGWRAAATYRRAEDKIRAALAGEVKP